MLYADGKPHGHAEQDPGDIRWTEDLAQQTFTDERGTAEPLLTPEEAACLRIQRGTLTDPERQMMEAHASETGRILDQVRFPPEYRNVPFWAAAHHEYPDGSGYPEHLAGRQIPTEVRLMTILDIFDSLVAADRPYKKARTAEEAFGILKGMEAQGKLDAALLEKFERSGAWKEIYG